VSPVAFAKVAPESRAVWRLWILKARDTIHKDMSLLKARDTFHKDMSLSKAREMFHRDISLWLAATL
jgi:hypothetical protein